MVGAVLHQEMLLGGRRNRLHLFRWLYAGWLIVARDALQLEFFPYPELDPLVNYAGCCLRVADARSLHAAFQDAGLSSSPHAVPRLTPPVDQSWGFREFALVDLDGNLLRGLEPLPAA